MGNLDNNIFEITPEKINSFLEGGDDQRRITNFECSYWDEYVTTWARNDNDERIKTEHSFFPFLWATTNGALSLFGGDKKEIASNLNKFKIGCKKLNVYNKDRKTTPRLEHGYDVLFYATRQMSHNTFSSFFKEGGIKNLYESKKDFLILSPVEQFMISTGKRQFKGFDEYDNLKRCTWDIETEGLNPKIHRITQIGIRTNHGFEKIIHVKGNNPSQLDKSEMVAIIEFIYILKSIDADIITGHNSENFDWEYLIVRSEELGSDFSKITKECFGKSIYKKKNRTVLKLGGETEYFNQTVYYGHTIIDSLHAVRRAQAIDSNMKSGNLKYAAQYAKIKKNNRVYIPGDKIAHLFNDTSNQYWLNENNGEWGIINNDFYSKTFDHGIKYTKIDENKISDNETHDILSVVTGEYIADRYLMDDLYEGDKVELHYNMSNFYLAKMLPIPYQKACTMGTAGIWRSLLLAWSYENNLAIPLTDTNKSITGGLSRLLKVGFIKDVVKLDFNSLYPSITITFNIAPDLDITGVFISFLTHILSEREKYKGLKKVAGKKVKELKEKLDSLNDDHSNKQELINEINKWANEEAKNDKLQLPFKIFANSFFGSYACPAVFNWGALDKGEEITCTGRQCLRLMVKWFEDRGFKAVVLDTDGVNYSFTDVYIDYNYTGKGLNRNVVEGKEYKGIEAYVAEFNDLYMRNKMGLGIDEFCPVTINFSRKNYVDMLENGSVKYVGNTIKSKKLPKYIEKFLDVNIKLLLNDDGQSFINNYYDHIEKIYNSQIPLRDIASIGSIKKSLKEYLKDVSVPNKAGNDRGRQAWYELAIKEKLNTNPGDKIYYVNIGTKKGDGDIKKTPIYQTDKNGDVVYQDRKDKDGNIIYSKRGNPPKPLKERITIGYSYDLMCVRIDNTIVESEKDYYGIEDIFETPIQYNVEKYVTNFNKRIKPLLVCFHPDIRDKILVTNPNDKKSFTKPECKLTAGFPDDPIDQDTLEQLFTMEDKEIRFWKAVNKIPPFIDEMEQNWDEIVEDYDNRQEILKQTGIKDEVDKYNNIIDKLTPDDVKDGTDSESLKKTWFIKELDSFLKVNNIKQFISKKYDVVIGSMNDITEKIFPIDVKPEELTD